VTPFEPQTGEKIFGQKFMTLAHDVLTIALTFEALKAAMVNTTMLEIGAIFIINTFTEGLELEEEKGEMNLAIRHTSL
jgi:hypothetical protein